MDECIITDGNGESDGEMMPPPAVAMDVGESYAADDPLWFQLGTTSSTVVLKDEHLGVQQAIELGSKMTAFLTILAHSLNQGDKLLVFSQSLITLDLIEKIVGAKGWGSVASVEPGPKCPDGTLFSSWKKEKQYERLDGTTPQSERQKLINDFTNKKRLSLLLVSTRAGGMGINLQAANRAVIFDSGWNPAYDLQAMHRCYRMGQKKNVFIYRLLSLGTMEEKIYKKQIVKQQLSNRVVDAEMPDNQYTLEETEELLAFDNDGYAHEDKLSLQEDGATAAACSSSHDNAGVIDLVDEDDMEGIEGVRESDGIDTDSDDGDSRRSDTEGADIVQDQERDIKAITEKISTGLVDPVMVRFMKEPKLRSLVAYVQDQTELLEDNEDEHLDEKEQEAAEAEMQQEELREQREEQHQAETRAQAQEKAQENVIRLTQHQAETRAQTQEKVQE